MRERVNVRRSSKSKVNASKSHSVIATCGARCVRDVRGGTDETAPDGPRHRCLMGLARDSMPIA